MDPKFLLVSQRQNFNEARNESIDSLDQAWTRFVEKLGYQIFPIPNREAHIENLFKLNVAGVILTGGGDIDHDQLERDKIERQLVHFTKTKDIPLLGVCRGAQLIAKDLGWPLQKVSNHVRVRHPLVKNEQSQIAHNLRNSTEVNSFHEYALNLNDISKTCEWILKASDNTVECFVQKSTSILGIMWHPEREAPFAESDLKFLSHFFNRELKW